MFSVDSNMASTTSNARSAADQTGDDPSSDSDIHAHDIHAATDSHTASGIDANIAQTSAFSIGQQVRIKVSVPWYL